MVSTDFFHLPEFIHVPEGGVAALRGMLPFRDIGHHGRDGARRLGRVQRGGRAMQERLGRLPEDIFKHDRHGGFDESGGGSVRQRYKTERHGEEDATR